jgi:hypothetical protein
MGKKLNFPPSNLDKFIPQVQQETYNPRSIFKGY